MSESNLKHILYMDIHCTTYFSISYRFGVFQNTKLVEKKTQWLSNLSLKKNCQGYLLRMEIIGPTADQVKTWGRGALCAPGHWHF